MQRTIPVLRQHLVRRPLATAGPASLLRSSIRPVVAPARSHLVAIPAPRYLTGNAAGGNDWKGGKDVSYSELKPLTQQPSDDVLLIDVREPDEVMMGSIPSSVNVPLSNFEKALDLDSSDFMRAYGFRKPSKDQKIIFYCKSGKRSATATSLAKGKGFGNVRNYVGSWSDWSAHQSKDSN